jgi:hypothetical protein
MEAGHEKAGVALYRKHVEALEAVFAIQPRIQEVAAALSVVDRLMDLRLKKKWQARAASLEGHEDE